MSGRRIEVHTMTLKDSSLSSSNPNDVKFGVTTPLKDTTGTNGELVLLPHDKPLSYAVEIVCERLSFKNPLEYALKFSEPPGHYVTDATRKELSGKLVSLNYSPEKVSRDVIEGLKSNADATITHALVKLNENAADPTVADVFVGHNGLNVLLDLLERDKQAEWFRDALAHALQALLDIMLLSSEASWDKLSPAVVSNVTSYVSSFNKACSPRALGPALQVLENVVTSGSAYVQVDKDVTLPVLVTHVQNADPKVQQNALALINALFGKSDSSKRKAFAATLTSRKYRDIIMQNVINRKPGERSSETNHELYVMQTLFLNILDEKRLTSVDPQDGDAETKIKELYRIAFETESSTYSTMSFDSPSPYARRDKSSNQRDYHKLGFSNEKKPALDFAVVPPGVLALDCMYHLAMSHMDEYSKIVLDSSSIRTTGDECPFARSSVALVNVLCDILKMGEPPSDQQGKFYPFFFQHEKPFEELYCICAMTVTKTWKEMRAAAEDFDKVFDVVSDQIRRALEKLPETFESLKSMLNTLSYNEIIKLRTAERFDREEWELKAKPIQDLREKIKPQIIELIKQNRINYLIAGTRFNKFTSKTLAGLTRTKDKFWFCRLSPNAKVFHYGECDEKATPLPEELQSKINVVDIKDLVTGKDCPHIKEAKSKKGSNVSLAFSIVTEKETSTTVDFIAPDDTTFNLWTDGINALLGKEMRSTEAEKDLEILLHMEIKLRLLEIEGIPELPQEPPPIPEIPTDFDFAAVQAQFAGNKYVVFN